MQYFCDVLDSWLIKKGRKRHGSVPSSSHTVELSYPSHIRARMYTDYGLPYPRCSSTG
ncbi:hypothetical protein M405DRAFT_828872 [Rhizopogon salebrosus TDB-379]|nr:hypothetical protein M405DRAFT_828872 [Rhizopogon salebrosus TDB-379]